MISLIVPIRVGEHLFEGDVRLDKLLSSVPADRYEVIVVDYGSPKLHAKEIENIVSRHPHARYLYVDAEHAPFSAGSARNRGAQRASHPIIMFNDVDVICSPEMYRRISEEADARDISNRYDFLSIPVAFLTFEGITEYNELHERNSDFKADALFHYHMIRGNSQFILNVAYSGSTIVVSKALYLAIGGTSEEFFGHGAEDFEVKLRLSGYRPIGIRPLDFYRNTKSNQMQEYVGFRAYLSLYGYEVFFRGIYMVHLWHPRREVASAQTLENSTVYRQTDRNFALLVQMARAFDTNGAQPLPLQDKSTSRKTLVLCPPNSLALESLRQALPLLGQFEVVDETHFADAAALQQAIEKNQYTNVLFLNPYGNEHRLALYNHVREKKIPYWVHDRGALPHSWFFDPNGFNADSSSYRPSRWDFEISDDERRQAKAYLQALKASAETLEVNGAPKSVSFWKSKFGIGHRKVLFVPLQRPSDTVTRYFCDTVGAYENFYSWVSTIASRLDPAEWVVLVKKHPAETAKPNIPGVQFVPNDAHIHDMIDLADVVLLLNSGVGLLSLAFGRPVVSCGLSFYASEGLATRARSIDEAVERIMSVPKIDEEKVLRFIHYLTTKFYSFAETEYVERKNSDGSTFLAARLSRYSSIRMLTSEPVRFAPPPRSASVDSILFGTFGGADAFQRARQGALIQSAGKAPTAKPAAPKSETLAKASDPPKLRGTAPDSLSQLLERARRAYHQSEFTEAAKLFSEAASLDPQNAEMRRAAAEAYDQAGNIREARRHILVAQALLPTNKNLGERVKALHRNALMRRLSKPRRFKVSRPKD